MDSQTPETIRETGVLGRLFRLQAHGTTARTEVIAGITTFLTMVYIIFVNPQILGAAGMDTQAVFVTTCLIAAFGCILMGCLANLPVALAPAMGLNAFFAFGVVSAMGYSWQIGMGAIFWGALGMLLLTVFRIRYWMIANIPLSLRVGITSGIGLSGIIFSFMLVNLFDSSGTLIGVTDKAGLADKDGKFPNMQKALYVDSVSSVIGGFIGTSSVTAYIESTSGVSVGGRTGLTAVVVGILFLLVIFLSPLAGMVPAYAVAGALIYVGVLMTSSLARVNWNDLTDAVPAFITAIMMPFSFSITDGIALGFISYSVMKLGTGRWKELNPCVILVALLFVLKFVFVDH